MMDGLKTAKQLPRSPLVPLGATEGNGSREAPPGVGRPLVRLYPCVPPALPDYLKRRRLRKRRGGSGHE